MIHIAPYPCAEGLIAGVGRHLAPGGHFLLYGPFRIGGAHTAPSNERFDQSLKSRDPRWGVRDLEDIQALASAAGLVYERRFAMPANNQILWFRAAGDEGAP